MDLPVSRFDFVITSAKLVSKGKQKNRQPFTVKHYKGL